jgi:hypothetical protein
LYAEVGVAACYGQSWPSLRSEKDITKWRRGRANPTERIVSVLGQLHNTAWQVGEFTVTSWGKKN